MLKLSDSVSKLHLVNASGIKALRRLDIETIHDLLKHYPRDWQDLSELKQIKNIRPDEKITFKAVVKKVSSKRTWRKKMNITEALLEDESGNVIAVWFNQPFIAKQLVKGRSYYFHGKGKVHLPAGRQVKSLQMQNPTFEMVKEETIHTAGIVPQYDLTEGVTQKQLRYWLKQTLDNVQQIKEYLPEPLLLKLKYPTLRRAVEDIHFPQTLEELQRAHERLAFDELFLFQLSFSIYKNKLKKSPAPEIKFDKEVVQNFIESLPFELTNSQRLAAWEILQGISNPHPMNRLLEGDVGSGKTVVAGIAMLQAARAGWQAVLLAPTEILALQHFETLDKLFSDDEIGILTRAHKNITPQEIESGKINIIVGTHALLQEKIQFNNIGLLIIDEQHRFGVGQRAHLQKQSRKLIPHLLSMTATPIPRSLALALYGDLDISKLLELPKGRKKIITRLVEPAKREAAYDFLKKEVKKGRQVYVVTPLIDEADPPRLANQGEAGKLGVRSATTEYDKLQKDIFPDFRVGLLHGRLKGEEKQKVMKKFRKHELDILVSTTVIEVGVDVPNATIMVIENAERFGLATLHQLRGRVGRSDIQSYCLLFAEDPSETTMNRLRAVVNSNDGFALAEKDLEIRGPGEILGTRQSGFVPFKIAKLSDTKLIKKAKKEAEKLLEVDPKLTTSPVLRKKVDILMKNIHLE